MRRSDFVEEMGRAKPRTVVELMDVANRFAYGEDAYHNKRARSPEDDRHPRPHNQRRRSRKYDYHNQVATSFKGKNNEEGEHRSIEYGSRHESGSSKQFQSHDLS
jgi:hypothetical protein